MFQPTSGFFLPRGVCSSPKAEYSTQQRNIHQSPERSNTVYSCIFTAFPTDKSQAEGRPGVFRRLKKWPVRILSIWIFCQLLAKWTQHTGHPPTEVECRLCSCEREIPHMTYDFCNIRILKIAYRVWECHTPWSSFGQQLKKRKDSTSTKHKSTQCLESKLNPKCK